MKIIDQTPFFKENGEISIVDRGKAIMQFGLGWFKDIEAQKTIIAVFEKVLDKNYYPPEKCNSTRPGCQDTIYSGRSNGRVRYVRNASYWACFVPKVTSGAR